MSIHNDYRQYGTEEEREEWKQEMKPEYRRQEAIDREYEEKMMEDEYEQSDNR